ncbi:MAG: hypothetical protein MR283_02820 [Erysipelotrichaceae bacterium]|nr:hypothetical protein [Erysipelotrichaceae bacterium]
MNIRNLYYPNCYIQFLRLIAHFHSMKIEHICSIFEQYPNASMLASYIEWKNQYQRTVRRNMKAIILSNQRLFDIHQTVGKHIEKPKLVDINIMHTIKRLMPDIDTTLCMKEGMYQCIKVVTNHTFQPYVCTDIEIKSILFCICTHYHIDVDELTFSSIHLWSMNKSDQNLKKSVHIITYMTDFLINMIEQDS